MGRKVVTTTVPGEPIVSSAVVQLRGTSGSGKSTAMRWLMAQIGAKPFQTNDKGTKVTVYRGKLQNGVIVFVLGDYSPHRSAGGCDTIPSVQEVIDLVEQYGSIPGSMVVLEGLLLAHSWGALGEYAHARWGERYINAFLDTPEEKCLARVEKRRAARGQDMVGDRADKIAKNIRDDYYRVELCYKRVIDRGGVRVDIEHNNACKEFAKLVDQTARRYCM